MNEEQFDNDVLEIELPAYQEDSFAIPDVPTESSFAENKEEIYRRNRLMAADMQMEVLAAKEESRAAKKAEFEGLYKESAAAVNYGRSMKIIFSVLAVMLAAVIAVVAILLIQMSGNRENVSVSADAEEIIAAVSEPEEAVSAATEVPKEKAEVSEKKEITVLTMDTSPLAEEEGTVVYDAKKISWRFAPYSGVDEEGNAVLYIDITAKKIVDELLYIVPEFSLVYTGTDYGEIGYLSEYEESLAKYPSEKSYRSVNGGDFEQIDPEPNALCFDGNGLCNFTMCFEISDVDDLSYDMIRYYPRRGYISFRNYTDREFDVPVDSLSDLVEKNAEIYPLSSAQ